LEKDKLRLELEQKAKERDALHILNPLVKRLDGIPIKLVDMTIMTNEKDKERFVLR